MRQFFWIITAVIFLIAVLLVPYATHAQDQAGSISGTVYRDINANGVCTGEGEPRVAANIPMELVEDDVGELVRISTAADGSYAHNTTRLGLWRVTVVPGVDWRVTSQQTLDVVLSVDNPNAADIDFCIIEVEPPPNGGGTLPGSGVAVAPALIMAASFGFILIAAGATLILISRTKKA